MLAELPELIDTHTHLDHEYPISTEEYILNAKQNGVSRFVTIGTTPESLNAVKNFSDKFPEVYFTVGIHPHESKDFSDEVAEKIVKLQTHSKCVGIGEIGLDYHYNHSDPAIQLDVLKRQLDLALNFKKPVIIHSRDAEEPLLEQLRSYSSRCTIPKRAGIIHCFSGTKMFAEECLKIGFYLSFSGIVTFKSAGALREIAKQVPIEKLLIETDSPFLTPVPHRGKPNQSSYLIETAKVLADLKGMTLKEFASETTKNAREIFAF